MSRIHKLYQALIPFIPFFVHSSMDSISSITSTGTNNSLSIGVFAAIYLGSFLVVSGALFTLWLYKRRRRPLEAIPDQEAYGTRLPDLPSFLSFPKQRSRCILKPCTVLQAETTRRHSSKTPITNYTRSIGRPSISKTDTIPIRPIHPSSESPLTGLHFPEIPTHHIHLSMSSSRSASISSSKMHMGDCSSYPDSLGSFQFPAVPHPCILAPPHRPLNVPRPTHLRSKFSFS